MPTKKVKATPTPAPAPVPPAPAAGADVLAQAAAAAQPGQEPELPPSPPDSAGQVFKLQVGAMDDGRIAIRKADERGNPMEDWQPEPEPTVSPRLFMPIHDLEDARALPDVTGGVYAAPRFAIDSPLAIRAFKDHDGRSMAVVWTGYTLAKAAITDRRSTT